MIELGSTYLITKNIERSKKFYESLLEMKVSYQNDSRWAQFNFNGHCIALFNQQYDKEKIEQGIDLKQNYNQAYLDFLKKENVKYGNNIVLNFYTENLKKEYERFKALNIGVMSEIMFINVGAPYYHFILEDPDGNRIEITGKYEEK